MLDPKRHSHVHHFLFGYDRGHTLIMGSDKLASSIEAHLARKSDLVPGVELNGTESYLSGFPVDDFKYALVMTWAAPEMSRPGCVWSHVILLERSMICESNDLSVFKYLFRQPVGKSDLDYYSKPLKLRDFFRRSGAESITRNSDFGPSSALKVLEAIYAPNSKGICEDVGSVRENLVLAIWSQQWDDLRMKFTFHTAVFNRTPDKKPLDSWITFVRSKRNAEGSQTIPEWLVLLLRGLRPSSQITLFFNSVGPSLPPERASVRLLARLRAFNFSNSLNGELKALEFLAREVEDPKSGLAVKNWLLDVALSNGNAKTLKDLLRFLWEQKDSKSFPNLWPKLLDRLPDLWNEDPLSYYSLFAIRMRQDNSELRSALEDLVADARSPKLFEYMSLGCWAGRLEIARIRPRLLVDNAITKAPEEFIIKALGITRPDPQNYRKLVRIALHSPLSEVATYLSSERFEEMSEAIFSLALGHEGIEYSQIIDDVWLAKIREQPTKFTKTLLTAVTSLSEIVTIFNLLEWDNRIFEGTATEDWSIALDNISTGVETEQQWAVVLMILIHAMSKREKGTEPLFEYSVPIVYNALMSGEAPEFIKSYMYENAAKYWTVQNWDLCARLRRQVENIYYYENLSSSNLESLFSVKTSRNNLLRTSTLESNDPDATFRRRFSEAGDKPLVEAVAEHRATLDLNTREDAPLDWAQTQRDLGNALNALGQRESGTERLEQAVAAYRTALEVHTREDAPLDWAQTQRDLGNALSALGQRESGTERLEQAVAAYRTALEVHTREDAPLDWAQTQRDLGNALSALGQRESGTERLEQAVAAYRTALEVHTREDAPLDWAQTQRDLGNALSSLGKRESRTERLEQAVAAYRTALKVYTREHAPLDWAITHANLAGALIPIAEETQDISILFDVTLSCKSAREVFEEENNEPFAEYAENILEKATELQEQLAGDSEYH